MENWTELENLQKLVDEFEAAIDNALRIKYGDLTQTSNALAYTLSPVRRWRLKDFFEVYRDSNRYPGERLGRAIHSLFDIKLQLYYITEVDLGLYQHLVQESGYDDREPLENPYALLMRLSFDQSLILKSRILWERIMNFVYYLETGNILEIKKSNNKSKRTAFFEFVKNNPRWQFLESYDLELRIYEDAFRTPETHKNSVLRTELFGHRKYDRNKLLSLINKAVNGVWENILAAIR